MERKIFLFNLRRNFDFIGRISIFLTIFFMYRLASYKEIRGLYQSLLLFAIVHFLIIVLYWVYFKIAYKFKKEMYDIDYSIQDIEDNWWDEKYTNKEVMGCDSFNGFFNMEEIKTKRTKLIYLFNKKDEIKAFNFYKENGFKVIKKEYMYTNFFKRLFHIRKDVRYTAVNFE